MNTSKKIYLLVCITCYSASSAVPSWDWLRNTCLGKQCSALVNKAYKHPYLAVASTVAIAVALQQLNSLYQQRKNQQEAAQAAHKVTNAIDTFIHALKDRGIDITNPNTFLEHSETFQYSQEWHNFWNPIYDHIIKKQTIPVDTAGSLKITPLYLLIKIIDPKGVQELIRLGADKKHVTEVKLPDGTNDTPLKAAYRSPSSSWQLREEQAKILSIFDDNSFSNYLQEKKTEYARAVDALQKYHDIENTKQNQNIVKNLITQNYISPDYQILQLQNKTAFHVAAQTNNQDLGAYLYDNGANILATDNDGNTVLHDASEMLEKLEPNKRVNNLFWSLLTDEYNRLLSEQCNPKKSKILTPISRNLQSKSPFDIFKQKILNL